VPLTWPHLWVSRSGARPVTAIRGSVRRVDRRPGGHKPPEEQSPPASGNDIPGERPSRRRGGPVTPGAAIRATAPPPGVLSIDAMEAARHAPHARVVTGSLPGSWFRPLPEDPSAVWINETGSASSGQSVLYAVDFDVTDPFESASLRLTVACRADCGSS